MTKEKNVAGLIMDNELHMVKSKITFRITADGTGKSLSLSSDDLGLMLQIPLEKVEEMLKWAVEK